MTNKTKIAKREAEMQAEIDRLRAQVEALQAAILALSRQAAPVVPVILPAAPWTPTFPYEVICGAGGWTQ